MLKYIFLPFIHSLIHSVIAIVIISSITVLVSQNVICFGYFMSMSHGINKETPTVVSPHLSPLPGFHQVYLLFFRKYLMNLFCSDQIIAKDNAFLK